MEVKPGYKQTEVGVIPEDWEVLSIDSIVTEISMGPFGSDIKVSNFTSSGVPVLSGANVRSERLSDAFANFVTPAKTKSLKKAVARRGDVVVTHRGTLGQISYIPDDSAFEQYVISQSQFRARFAENLVTPCWVVLYFRSERGAGNLLEGKGHTGVPAIAQPTKTFRKLCIPLPPLPEQRAIAAALSDVDALLGALDRLIAKKRDLKQAAMQQLLTPRPGSGQASQTRLPGFTGEWEVKTFGELFKFSGGYSASRDQLSSDGHCYLHYGDIHGSTKSFVDVRADFQDIPKLNIPLKRVASKSLLEDGDVVFVDASEDDEGTSRHVVVVNKDKKPFISGLHTIVAKSKTDELVHEYRRYCFQTAAIRQQFLFYAVGTKVSGISKTNIAKLKLRIPPLPEQTAVAVVLSDMDAELAALVARRDKTRALKQAMMQELLTGRIRLV
jgi:type I restriction enzyme S subunit